MDTQFEKWWADYTAPANERHINRTIGAVEAAFVAGRDIGYRDCLTRIAAQAAKAPGRRAKIQHGGAS